MTLRVDYIPQPPDWMKDALCTQLGDPDLFFPDKGGSTREAKAVCRRCPVQAECLERALESREPFGVWGGASERDRRNLNGDTADDLTGDAA